MEVKCIVNNDTQLGEGPVWDFRTDTLYWVDILNGWLQAYDYHSGKNRVFEMGEYTGAVVPSSNDRLLVALQNKVAWFDPTNEQLETFCEPEPGLKSNRFNDGKCDPMGRFWIGSTQVDHQDPTGVLYCVNTDGGFVSKLDNLLISNGMAWSPDGTILYYIDSPTQKVQAFEFDLATGNIQFLEDTLVFSTDQGVPDGMCIDSQGNLWVAFYGGGKVVCYEPSTGKRLETVEVPAINTTSCCFGGPSMDELFITTARRDDPQGGGLYVCKPGISGPHANFFKVSN